MPSAYLFTATSVRRRRTCKNGPLIHNALDRRKIPGGYVVKDASGQALVYVYARDMGCSCTLSSMLEFSLRLSSSASFGSVL
jgi:hypothetical protein